MRTIAQLIIEQAEADRRKYGYKKLYICNIQGLVYEIEKQLIDGFINPQGAIISYISIGPVIPIPETTANQINEKETGLLLPSKGIIIPHPGAN